MFSLALILLSGSLLGSLLGLGRGIGVPRAFGFDGVGARRGVWPPSRGLPMFRLILLSGAMLGSLLGLVRSTGVPRAFGFDGGRARRGLLQATFPEAANV